MLFITLKACVPRHNGGCWARGEGSGRGGGGGGNKEGTASARHPFVRKIEMPNQRVIHKKRVVGGDKKGTHPKKLNARRARKIAVNWDPTYAAYVALVTAGHD
ncbi:unnamed protein product, partial [Iphiclides podalirius]